MESGENGVPMIMAAILGTMVAILAGLISIQTPIGDKESKTERDPGETSASLSRPTFLPLRQVEPSKYAYEMFALCYTPVWITAFGVIVLFRLYESFTATTYNVVCIGLASPFLLQPILVPSAFFRSPDTRRPITRRYAFKANVWLAVYSFIGNYWYTHYFYSVLKASYTMPAHRFNDVPVALYFATHFYFSTYHLLSNACLRGVVTAFRPSMRRTALYVSVVVALSYFTAFAETLTISSFPYYSFADRDMAYTVGSAFYGVYFLVSFPAFFHFDEQIDSTAVDATKVTVWDAAVSSCGYGMMILMMLDFVRLYLGVPLVVGNLS